MLKKFEVGYKDEMIGVYYAETAEDAKRQCREDIAISGFVFQTPFRKMLGGLIANQVGYA